MPPSSKKKHLVTTLIPDSNATLLARSAKDGTLDSYEKLQKITF
jgi:hypothetical protein